MFKDIGNNDLVLECKNDHQTSNFKVKSGSIDKGQLFIDGKHSLIHY